MPEAASIPTGQTLPPRTAFQRFTCMSMTAMGPRCCVFAASLVAGISCLPPYGRVVGTTTCSHHGNAPGLFADDAPFAGQGEPSNSACSESVQMIGRAVEGDAPRKPEQRVHRRLLACRAVRHMGAASIARPVRTRLRARQGSLWYPGFRRHTPRPRTSSHRTPALRVFLAWQSKEARTPSRLLRNVAQGTRDVVELFETRGVPTIFEQNPGNHFKEPALRMAKGIVWALGR